MNLVVGGVTTAAGVILVLRHLHLWRLQSEQTPQAGGQQYLNAQVRRRCLTSSAIALLGIVIASFYWTRHPNLVLGLLICAFVLLVMIALMAMLDLISIRIMMQQHRRPINEAGLALRDEYNRLKQLAKAQASDEAAESHQPARHDESQN